MSEIQKTLVAIILGATIIIAGIFCYQGIQTMDSHCNGGVDSIWCSDFTIHGTIISSAILNIFITLISAVLIVFVAKPLLKLFHGIKQIIQTTQKNQNLQKNPIPILLPIQSALSDGIIHPRIP